MTDRQDATVQMFQEEDRLFISEATKIEKEIVLKKHAAQFHSIVFDIAKYMQAQEFDSKGYAIKKKLAKKKLSELMFKLTSAYCSYGIDTKNSVIVEEFDNSITDNQRLKDAEFVNYANRLIASLGENIKDLKPYHITAENLTNLSNETKAYSDLLHIPEEVIKDKAIATEKIKELISEGNNLLKNSIDRDMVYFKDTDEPFYAEYLKRREINDADTHHLSIKGTVVDADGKKPLPHVKCTVKFKAGSELADKVKTTSHIGNFQFKDIPDGECLLTFTLEFYDTVIKQIAVYSDRATRLDVEMERTSE